jgi:phosphatidylglycerophosphate synthase
MENGNSGFIDSNYIYPIANLFIDYTYCLNITPNIITTFTLILRLIVVYLLIHKIHFEYVPYIYFISWITDAMDGQLARKYNLGSKFGGYYDTFVDILTTVLICCTLYKYYNKKITILLVLLIFLIFFIISLKKVKNKKNLKFWEKIIYNKSLSTDLNKNKLFHNFLNIIDPGTSYFTIFIFLIIITLNNSSTC